MPTLVALYIVITTTSGATCDNKHVIVTTQFSVQMIWMMFGYYFLSETSFGLQELSLPASAGWETKKFWHSPELGSLLYSLYKIPLAQACFPLTQPNFHSQAGER